VLAVLSSMQLDTTRADIRTGCVVEWDTPRSLEELAMIACSAALDRMIFTV
jgi:hypothetical protein